jgi:glycosyltransferase involved in cell wall biosynthesis
MKARTRHWTINGDFVALQPTGVPRYARETVLALDRLIGEGHPLTENLYTDLIVPCDSNVPRLRNIPVRHVPQYDRPRLPQLWVQMQLPRYVRGGLVSLCNLAPLRVKKHIVCIHDLHTYLYPESYSRIFRLAHRLILPALGRRAAAITTVSGLSRAHLDQFGIAPLEKITVTYNGADHARRWNPANSALQIGPRPFIFCIGQKQSYKNMRLVWSIAPALDALGFDIYMAGNVKRGDLPDGGRELPRNLRVLGRVSDDDLARAFQHAFCFLFPSRIEGFGLPAIEAMIWKCPVIAADAPCLPEVCGDAALYAAPDNRQAWLDAIAALATDPVLYQSQIANGSRRALQFSWRHVAEIYLQLMARLDGIGILPDERSRFQSAANAMQRPGRAANAA